MSREYNKKPNFHFRIYSNEISSTEHIGTHIDAPSHFAEHGWRNHQIPLSRLIGPGVIINVKDKVKNNPDYRLTVADVKKWEAKYGAIPEGAMVIMNTGWAANYPDRKKVFNTTDPFNTTSFHYPGFGEEAVSWIINNRNMYVIGTDCPSFDTGNSKTFPAHVLTSKNNICGLENVANLDAIPPTGAILSAAPVKTIEGSGGPIRLYAMIPINSGTGSISFGKRVTASVLICILAMGVF